MREHVLMFCLVVAAALVVAGVALWSAAAALVVAGVLLAVLAWLGLADDGAPSQ